MSDGNPRKYRRVTPEQRAFAQELRRKMTLAEEVLWEELRGHRMANLHFRRQHPISGFIVDFYCHEARLIVEVDGPYHDFQQARDAWRESILTAGELTILRFTNEQVLNKMPEVRAEIERFIEEGLCPPQLDSSEADDANGVVAKRRRGIPRKATPELRKQALYERNNLSAAEHSLWQALRGRRMEGLRFRCKHVILGSLVDFYCYRAGLVIVVDGRFHDKRHEALLGAYGISMLRFKSAQILNDMSTVLAEIRQFLKANPQLGERAGSNDTHPRGSGPDAV